MNRPGARASFQRRPFGWRAGLVVGLIAVALGGCDELSARSEIQKGNGSYNNRDWEGAVKHYETALRKAPHLDVAHHNLGITYSRMFHPGVETDENVAIANKAAEHLAIWLKSHPKDSKVRKLLTGLWIDSGNYNKALEYWTKLYEADPKARDVIQLIAGIHLKSGDWRAALDWYRKDVDAASDKAGKVSAYQAIANLTFNKIYSLDSREKVIGTERTELAEVGIEAAGKGLELDPENMALVGISAGLWLNHGTAQGPFWAATIDRAESQVFEQRARVLREQAKKDKPASSNPKPGSGGKGG